MHTKNRIIIATLCIWCLSLASFAQMNINIDDSCVDKNSLLLYTALVNAKEDSLISSLLEDNCKLLLMITTDSLGNPVRINRIRTNLKVEEQNLHKRLTNILINNTTKFFICYSIPYKLDEKQSVLSKIKHELRVDKKNEFTISVGFPGSIMVLYEYEKSKNKNLTRSKYLKQHSTPARADF